jgi:2'-hydroxyisoflavone reductase
VNVLILGGTVFLSRTVAATLVARGHRVTTFTRGTHDVDRQLPIARITGDRARDLQRIPRDGWDAVVDVGNGPAALFTASTTHLARAARYVYVSSVNVYDTRYAVIDEDTPLLPDDGCPIEAYSDEVYGVLKLRAEAIVGAAFGARASIVRPGLIVGPGDPTDRFTAWPVRFARGGEILAPASPQYRTQFIDVRDCADAIVALLEGDLGGIYNLTSPRGRFTLGDVFDACADDVPASTVTSIDDLDFLERHGITGWTDLPLWLPPLPGFEGFLNLDVTRAQQAGILHVRPLAETVRATRAWQHERGSPALQCGLPPEREAEILTAWHAVT